MGRVGGLGSRSRVGTPRPTSRPCGKTTKSDKICPDDTLLASGDLATALAVHSIIRKGPVRQGKHPMSDLTSPKRLLAARVTGNWLPLVFPRGRKLAFNPAQVIKT